MGNEEVIPPGRGGLDGEKGVPSSGRYIPSISHFAWKNAELPGHAETVAVVRARIAAVNFIVLDGACEGFFLVKS